MRRRLHIRSWTDGLSVVRLWLAVHLLQLPQGIHFCQAVEVDFTIEEMARLDLQHWQSAGTAPSAEEIQSWVDFMRTFLRGLELGRRYVYLDGVIIPTDANGFTVEGIHSSHDLAVVPHVAALRDPSIIHDLLGNPQYWDESSPSD